MLNPLFKFINNICIILPDSLLIVLIVNLVFRLQYVNNLTYLVLTHYTIKPNRITSQESQLL